MSDAKCGLAVQGGCPSGELPVQEASSDRPNSQKEAKKPSNKPDWKAIKEDYLTNCLSAKALGEKYQISQWTIYKRSLREGWAKASGPVRDKARQAVQRIATLAVAKAAAKAEPAIQAEVEAWTRRIRETGGKIVAHADRKLSKEEPETKDLRELASTADIADRMVRRSLGLDSPDSTGSTRPTVLALSVRLESLGLSEQSPVPACIDVETVREEPEQAGNGPNET